MKTIEIEDDLYAYIASQTQHIGENASEILYRLLMPKDKIEDAIKQTSQAAQASGDAAKDQDIAKSEAKTATNSKKTAKATKTAKTASKAQAKSVKTTPAKSANGTQASTPLSSVSIKVNATDLMARLKSSGFDQSRPRVEFFLHILAQLNQVDTKGFEQVLAIKGRNRLYFAKSKDELLAAGSSTNPKQIPESSIWVVTNNNTAKKVSILKEVLTALGYHTDTAIAVAEYFAA